MPAGRLREPLAAAAAADAALITAGYDTAAERIGRALRRVAGLPRDARDRRAAARRRRARLGRRPLGLARVRRRRHRAAGALRRRHPVGRLGHLRRHRVPRSPPVHGARRAADRGGGKGDRGDDRADDGEGRGAADRAATSASCRSRRCRCTVGVEPADAFERWLAGTHSPSAIESASHQQSIRSRSATCNPQSAIPMRHRLEYLIVRALIAVVRVTPGFVVRGAGHAARPGVLHARPRAPAHRRSAIWRRRFPSRPEARAARHRARARSRTSAGCCSSC